MLFLEWGYIFYNLCSRAQENNSQKINFDTRSQKKYVENNIRISGMFGKFVFRQTNQYLELCNYL